MPLRIRLILLVALALVLSLALGGTLAWINAKRSVRTEMDSALTVARQTIASEIASAQGAPDWRRDLDRLVASFNGNRHLRVSLSDDPVVARPPVEAPPVGAVPGWFETAIGVAPAAIRIPVVIDGRPHGAVTVETVPHNEVLEVWDELSEPVLVLALFSGATIVLIYLFVGQALRPLDRLNAALAAIGRGDYGTRIEGRLPPELSRLRDSFNRMSGELSAMAEQNRRLTGELLTLQEQERGDIARDLHDEVGPFLFGINVDAANIARALDKGHGEEIPFHLRSITDAVGQLQGQVRDMLGRLRPIGLDEFGLAAAIGNLVEFWRRRNPDIRYVVAIGRGTEAFGETIDRVVYRIVQEGLSNSIRHGRPTRVGVTIAHQRDGAGEDGAILVEVGDDGGGIDAEATPGYGLLGMSERVKALGGRIAIDSKKGRGLTIVATLPSPRLRNRAATHLT
ncbi:MAG TPA: sensor histidine kinase [Stellaceae bacterium]|jgi:two-component system sensor histidine kinase UhpB|nr:sensor histidine kinase [Stellaceae bacterium]